MSKRKHTPEWILIRIEEYLSGKVPIRLSLEPMGSMSGRRGNGKSFPYAKNRQGIRLNPGTFREVSCTDPRIRI